MKKKSNTSITTEFLQQLFCDPVCAQDFVAKATPQALAQAVELAFEEYSQGVRTASAFLCRAAKKKAGRSALESCLLPSRNILAQMLSCDDAKMRKNTARLIGELSNTIDSAILVSALQTETIRMVVPSIILALGAIGDAAAYAALRAYSVPEAKDTTEKKHEAEERNALLKALSMFSSGEKHQFTSFSNIPYIRLICPSKMAVYTANELDKLGITVKNYTDSTVDVVASDIATLYSVRSFREALIPISSKNESCTDLQQRILKALDATHAPTDAPYRFRIEYRSANRQAGIESILQALSCERLQNSVSDYEVEVRVHTDGSIRLRLFTYADERFSYRKASIPASIHPANAAAVMSFASNYFTENATVLDMCCGSGTMLFERALAKKCKHLIGVDISGKAISAARENANAFGKKIEFLQKDCTRLVLHERVDEVVCNLPFGNRVGTHADNANLYHSIFNKLGQWLKPGGIAVLYTMESKLIKSEVKASCDLSIVDSTTTDAGGLYPTVFIIRKV